MLWPRDGDPAGPLRIRMDPLIPTADLRQCLLRIQCEEEPLDVAYGRWTSMSSRVALQLLYEALHAHGVRTHPSQEDALRGWDDLHQQSLAVVPRDLPVALPGPQPLSLIQNVETLQDLTEAPESEPLFSHLWVVHCVCRFPMKELQRLDLPTRRGGPWSSVMPPSAWTSVNVWDG